MLRLAQGEPSVHEPVNSDGETLENATLARLVLANVLANMPGQSKRV